jgi:predicted sulfurtransferase
VEVPQIRQFSDFPAWVDDNVERLRGKTVMMYCTGGVRCERASAYLIKKGAEFENVIQLEGDLDNSRPIIED